MKIYDHHVRSPVLNINRACQTCHKWSEEELKARLGDDPGTGRSRCGTWRSTRCCQLTREIATQVQADSTVPTVALARDYQRKAQFLADLIEAENSMGFHADQEAAARLAKSVDLPRPVRWRYAGRIRHRSRSPRCTVPYRTGATR
jgi:nitrite reductase (cytochrome c-552)